RNKLMSQDGSILRSVLYGMFLGLAIIAGWLYYPQILAVFHSEVPEVADHLTAIKDKIEKVRLLIPTPAPDKKAPVSTQDVPAAGIEAPAPAKQLVQNISKTHPFDKQTLYPFWRFDESRTAEDFMAKIQKRTGVDLTLGQEGYRYVVYIPAASEGEKKEKAELIKRETGIIGLKDGGL
ncbi:MAG: hypothetical protein MUP26_01165, partial [Desulfobulbaceae bacterium]|nr:hypothetical protein [Desulfobulbaceae bacterium]